MLHKNSSKRVGLAAAGALILATTACAGSGMEYATYSGSGAGPGDAAQLVGEVRNDGGCLTVVTDAGEVIIPIFASDDPRASDLRDGQQVELMGGASSDFGESHDVPDVCASLSYGAFTVTADY